MNFPYRDTCVRCGARGEYDVVKLSRRGRIHSFSIISTGSSPPEFYEAERKIGQYGVAIVELGDGVRVMAQLTEFDPDEIEIGAEVEAVIRRLYEEEGVVRYCLKFRPPRTRGYKTT